MEMCLPVEDVEGLDDESVKYYKGNVNSIGNYLRKGDEVGVVVK